VGTAVAQSHLKHTLLYLNARVLGAPEFYLARAHEKFDTDGSLIDEKTRSLLKNALSNFADFIQAGQRTDSLQMPENR
jgi:chromate reductase